MAELIHDIPLPDALRKVGLAGSENGNEELGQLLAHTANVLTAQGELLDRYRVLTGLEEAATKSALHGHGRSDIYNAKGEAYQEVLDHEQFLVDLVGGDPKGPVEP